MPLTCAGSWVHAHALLDARYFKRQTPSLTRTLFNVHASALLAAPTLFHCVGTRVPAGSGPSITAAARSVPGTQTVSAGACCWLADAGCAKVYRSPAQSARTILITLPADSVLLPARQVHPRCRVRLFRPRKSACVQWAPSRACPPPRIHHCRGGAAAALPGALHPCPQVRAGWVGGGGDAGGCCACQWVM